MVIARGEVWWADLPAPRGSAPGYRHPVLVLQSDRFNRSAIGTIVAVVITSNLRLADAPGNVRLRKKDSGLPRDSVANVSQIATLDRSDLVKRVGRLGARLLASVDNGLGLVLDLA